MIDNDIDLVEVYEQLLSELGIEVDVASDGETGLEKAFKGGYKLIVLEVVVPKIDGLGVLARLYEGKSLMPNGPTLVMTSLPRGLVSSKAVSLGAIGCLNKDCVVPGQFVGEVKKFLQMTG